MSSPKPQATNFQALADQGFPKKISQVFQKTADELNCVVLSRVPGVVTTTLIDEGYNLKPFDIKGKSCNWGPMAGFVCQLPVFNKAGTKKMIGNLNAHVKSLKELKNKQTKNAERILAKIKGTTSYKNNFRNFVKLAQDFEEVIGGTKQFADVVAGDEFAAVVLPEPALNREMTTASYLFVPVSISDKRKQELITKETLGQENTDYKKVNNDLIVGLVFDNDSTVAIEYAMRRIRQSGSVLWEIYHRNIFIKKELNSREQFVSYLSTAPENGFSIKSQSIDNQIKANETLYNAAIDEFNHKHGKNLTLSGTENTAIQTFFNAQKNTKREVYESGDNPLSIWHPIHALQSPFLAYTDPKNIYKNAVSGDYDLFAAWPFAPAAGFEVTTRISELASQPSPLGSNSQNLFIPIETKKYALEIVKSRNVFIEFIGRFDELAGVEDPEVGNINELVAIAAQTLNSLVQLQYRAKGFPFPNRAFHSDEGGRPQVDEIEYPIACFMPTSQWRAVQPTKRKGESKASFNARKTKFQTNAPLLKGTAGLINSHIEFLAIVLALKQRFHIFLHDGWIMHLVLLSAGKTTLTNNLRRVEDKRKSYFEARINEIQELEQGNFDEFKRLVKQLVLSLESDTQFDAPTLAAYNNAFDRILLSLMSIAAKNKLPDINARMEEVLTNQLIKT